MIQIFATFEHSIKLEMALSTLELEGISKTNILAVPLTSQKRAPRLFDSIHYSDGVSLISTGAALATAFSVVGTSIGFALAWGPVYWGLIGATCGFILGFLIDLLAVKILFKRRRRLRGKNPQVILIVACEAAKADQVEHILWHCLTLGTARLESSPETR